MDVTSLGFRTDVMLRQLAGSTVEDREAYLVVRTPENPGYWWGNFVLCGGPPRPGDTERWVETFAREFPDAGHLAIGLDGTGGEVGDPDKLARLGIETQSLTVLTAGRLTAPATPASAADIRPLTGDADWAQAAELRLARADESEQTSTEHRLFAARKLAEDRRLCEAGYGAWFGAFADGRLRSSAGLFTDGRGPARYQDVATHPGFRGRGFATNVVYEAGRWGLTQLRARTLVIVAGPGHHAIRLYRALGFADTERQVQLQRAPR